MYLSRGCCTLEILQHTRGVLLSAVARGCGLRPFLHPLESDLAGTRCALGLGAGSGGLARALGWGRRADPERAQGQQAAAAAESGLPWRGLLRKLRYLIPTARACCLWWAAVQGIRTVGAPSGV